MDPIAAKPPTRRPGVAFTALGAVLVAIGAAAAMIFGSESVDCDPATGHGCAAVLVRSPAGTQACVVGPPPTLADPTACTTTP